MMRWRAPSQPDSYHSGREKYRTWSSRADHWAIVCRHALLMIMR